MAKLPLATMVLFLKWELQLPLEHMAKGLHPTLLLQRQTPLPLAHVFREYQHRCTLPQQHS